MLTGSTRREDVSHYPYHPDRIVESIAAIDPIVLREGRASPRTAAPVEGKRRADNIWDTAEDDLAPEADETFGDVVAAEARE